MTKQELMKNYTMEQLAEMVIKFQNHFDTIKFADSLANAKLFSNPKVAACESRIEILQKENEILKSQLDRKQTEIDQIDEILNELFGVTHDISNKPEYFKEILRNRLDGETAGKTYSEKQDMTKSLYGMYKFSSGKMTKDDVLLFLGVLTKELIENGIDFKYDMEKMKVYDITVKNYKTIAELLPIQPIKVADMLINTHKRTICENTAYYNKMFGASEIRQIAEHLLVYCNANESEGEE